MKILTLKTLAVLSLAGCGGGGADGTAISPDPHVVELRALAAEKKTEAISLAANAPCVADSQCSILIFDFPDPGCNLPTRDSYFPYSLISTNAAAAQDAAAGQRALASQSRAAQGTFTGPCPAIAVLPPIRACVASKCVLKSALTGELIP